MDAGDFEAEGGELGGLVVHEGDERADNECGAAISSKLAGDGGELVAEAFAGSCGHDEEDVAAAGGGLADGLLVDAEAPVAEGLVEKGGEVLASIVLAGIVLAGIVLAGIVLAGIAEIAEAGDSLVLMVVLLDLPGRRSVHGACFIFARESGDEATLLLPSKLACNISF